MTHLSRVAGKVDELYEAFDRLGTLQLAVDDTPVSGRFLHLDGRPLLHFGNCSYMGLETDERLKAAAHAALDRFGVCFSMSRSFAHIPLTEELEAALSRMYGGAPVVVSTMTTMGHLSALPVFVADDNVAILDYMAHASLQMAGALLRGSGVRVEIIRHGSIEALEKKIASLSSGVKRIWYIADGVYSMFGDLTPFEELNALMDREPRLHLYLDDAHGVGWCGSNGSGVAFDRVRHKDRLCLAISLSKGFGAMGGAVVLPDERAARVLRRTGANQIFNGPIPPASMAAACVSAQLMCTDEIALRRYLLHAKMRRFIDTCHEHGLALCDESLTPIFYLKIGRPEVALELGRTLMDRGIYVNTVGFPAVPLRSAGLRMTITHHNRMEDIDRLLEQCAAATSCEQKVAALAETIG